MADASPDWTFTHPEGRSTTILGNSRSSIAVALEDPAIAKATVKQTVYVYRSGHEALVPAAEGELINNNVLFTHTNADWRWKNNPWNERYEIPAGGTIYVTSGDGIAYLDGQDGMKYYEIVIAPGARWATDAAPQGKRYYRQIANPDPDTLEWAPPPSPSPPGPLLGDDSDVDDDFLRPASELLF